MRNTNANMIVIKSLEPVRSKIDSARVRLWDQNYEEALGYMREAEKLLADAREKLVKHILAQEQSAA